MFTTSSVVAETLSLCRMPTRIPLLEASTMKASPSVMQAGAFGDLVMKSVVSSHVKLFFVEALHHAHTKICVSIFVNGVLVWRDGNAKAFLPTIL